MRYLLVEWQYKIDCPYCDRFKRYVLNPLEEMGFVVVREACMDGAFSGAEVARNKRISRMISGKSRVEVPLLIDLKHRAYFLPFSPRPGAAVEDSVRVMAENFIEHLARVLGIDPRAIINEPRIRKALMLDKKDKSKAVWR